jgi:LCP family protein required for cell wall assembly
MRSLPRVAALLLLCLGVFSLVGVAQAVLDHRFLSPASPRRGLPARGRFGDPGAELAGEVRPAPRVPWWVDRIEAVATPPLSETLNLLLVGIDTRPEMPWGGRTDAMVVVVLDLRSEHVGLVSIPRDLLVAIPGGEPNRINTVYNQGVREGGPERGLALLKETVRATFGLPITGAVLVDHAGFEALVDHLEGITVVVPCAIRDRFIDPRGPGGRLPLRVEAGVRHLDGQTALMYARSRHGRSIFDRAIRQQAILLGLRDRLLELGPTRTVAAIPHLQRTVRTEVGPLDAIRLARRLHRIKREHIHGLVLDPRHADVVTLDDGRWVMVPKPTAIHDALAHLFEAKAPGLRRSTACPPEDAALR